tara:strand:+ start:2648 stop:2818 length:171 start_codon:yes stop_codon:yes gene_type:complete
MQIGDLVRGKKNELLGYVTNARNNWFGSDWVMVYWFEIEVKSTRWINIDGLEALCK